MGEPNEPERTEPEPEETAPPGDEAAETVEPADDAAESESEGEGEPATDPASDIPDDALSHDDEPAASAEEESHHGRHAGQHVADDVADEAPDGGPRDEPAPPGGLRGWSGLRTLLRPRINTSQLIVAVLCAALGFALIVQVHQNQSDNLSSLRQSDLVRLLDDVTQRTQTLEKEQNDLTTTRDRLKSSSGSRQAAIDLATQRAQVQGILSGRLPAEGPGIRLKITQGTQVVGAATMFNVLEELRNAGAEAVQVNDVRLVASSWFEVHGDTLVADGQPLGSPYVWKAIGDPDTLAPALGIPGGALAAVRNTGATAEVTTPKKVEVTATREPGTPQYATPKPVPTGSGS
ncbi:hypothetical protein GCM10025864_37090 [Luteimicrobium album]|uniref:DUF881 domain-containing protein n=1 Tax=Luteimicrobium album TaxID=1054550 RepID=A0ABQ6I885_9MICO|nr:DUF881 domain-containing protein [Luteimicrobium album]GMA25950.1 hypothetical protein GCM10025864_37090 [Luteimicrobium album]